MKRLKQIYKIILVFCLILTSCSYSYKKIRVGSTIAVNEKYEIIDKKYYSKTIKGQASLVFIKPRYLAFKNQRNFAAKTNKKAVFLILDGKLQEALIYLQEVMKENDNLAEVYNNMGVIYDLSLKKNMAFKYYSKACLLKPENIYFNENFKNMRSGYEL